MSIKGTSVEKVSRALALEVIRLRQEGYSLEEAYVGLRFFYESFSTQMGRYKALHMNTQFDGLLVDSWWVDQDWVEC